MLKCKGDDDDHGGDDHEHNSDHRRLKSKQDYLMYKNRGLIEIDPNFNVLMRYFEWRTEIQKHASPMKMAIW